MPRTSLLGTIEIASLLIGKVRIENDDSNKDQFLLEKPDVYSRRDSQEVSAKLTSDVYSRGDGSTEYLFKKPDVYSRRDSQEVSTELDKSEVYSRRNSPTEFLFTEPVRSQKNRAWESDHGRWGQERRFNKRSWFIWVPRRRPKISKTTCRSNIWIHTHLCF